MAHVCEFLFVSDPARDTKPTTHAFTQKDFTATSLREDLKGLEKDRGLYLLQTAIGIQKARLNGEDMGVRGHRRPCLLFCHRRHKEVMHLFVAIPAVFIRRDISSSNIKEESSHLLTPFLLIFKRALKKPRR